MKVVTYQISCSGKNEKQTTLKMNVVIGWTQNNRAKIMKQGLGLSMTYQVKIKLEMKSIRSHRFSWLYFCQSLQYCTNVWRMLRYQLVKGYKRYWKIYVAHSELNLIIFVVFLLSQATWMFDVLSHTSDLYQGSAPVDR